MKQEQLRQILKTIREIPTDNDEKALAVLQAAADSITLEKLVALTGKTDNQFNEQSGVKSQELSFSEEEIRKMPKTFRKEFRVQGCTAHVHKIRSGKKNWCYVIRYRRNGYNVNASSTNLEEAKRRFIQRLQEADRNGGSPALPFPPISTALRTISLKTSTNVRLRQALTVLRLTNSRTTSTLISKAQLCVRLRQSNARSLLTVLKQRARAERLTTFARYLI